MRSYRIAVIRGDGIGPEQIDATLPVLRAIEPQLGAKLEFIPVDAGDNAKKQRGAALPEETLEVIKQSTACLKGPVGETAADVIVKLRLMFDLYVNLRPVKTYPKVPSLHPNIDILLVRENTEDVYRGLEFMLNDNTSVALKVTTIAGSRRIAEYAFKMGLKRRRHVTVIHKSNVLRVTDAMFLNVAREVARAYPSITLRDMLVDTAAMELIREPRSFDVILTPNLYGDILSDEAAQLVGGLGMAPGANIGKDFALFEPVHGCALDIAGQQRANPCSMILASALMLDWLGETHNDRRCAEAAVTLEKAVTNCLSRGITTPDLGGTQTTQQVGEAIAKEIERNQTET